MNYAFVAVAFWVVAVILICLWQFAAYLNNEEDD